MKSWPRTADHYCIGDKLLIAMTPSNVVGKVNRSKHLVLVTEKKHLSAPDQLVVARCQWSSAGTCVRENACTDMRSFVRHSSVARACVRCCPRVSLDTHGVTFVHCQVTLLSNRVPRSRLCVSSEKPQIKTQCRMPIGSGDQLVCHVILLEKQTWLNKNKNEYPSINQPSSALSQFCLLLWLGHPSLMSFDIPKRTFSSKSRNI